MKTSLHLDSLHLKVRGVPVATAAAAVRGLAPALARELGSGMNSGADGKPAAVPRRVSESALRQAVASRVAGAVHSHLRSQTGPA